MEEMLAMSEEAAPYGHLSPEQVEEHLKPLRELQRLEAMLDLTPSSPGKPSSDSKSPSTRTSREAGPRALLGRVAPDLLVRLDEIKALDRDLAKTALIHRTQAGSSCFGIPLPTPDDPSLRSLVRLARKETIGLFGLFPRDQGQVNRLREALGNGLKR